MNNSNPTIETLQKEINILTEKLEGISKDVRRFHIESQNRIKFCVAEEQILLKYLWQMNIPAIGEIVEIPIDFVEDEIYSYVSELFENQKSKKNGSYSLYEYFSFTVKSVVCRFTDEIIENEIVFEYIVYLMPNVSTKISKQ